MDTIMNTIASRPMGVTSFYPVLMTGDVAKTAGFYQTMLGFRPVFEADWYVHLQHPDNDSVNLAVMHGDHDTIPQQGRGRSGGMLLNIEVPDVDAVHQKLAGLGADIIQPLRSEAFGQRHFIIAGPDGVLIDLITPIPPSAEFAALYQGQ